MRILIILYLTTMFSLGAMEDELSSIATAAQSEYQQLLTNDDPHIKSLAQHMVQNTSTTLPQGIIERELSYLQSQNPNLFKTLGGLLQQSSPSRKSGTSGHAKEKDSKKSSPLLTNLEGAMHQFLSRVSDKECNMHATNAQNHAQRAERNKWCGILGTVGSSVLGMAYNIYSNSAKH